MKTVNKRILSLCVAVVMIIGLTSCIYPDNVMFSAHQIELYHDFNATAKDFSGITDSAYGRGLPDYGDPSLNDQFDVTIAYWPEDNNPNAWNICGGQTIHISGDFNALSQMENGQPYIRLPIIMKIVASSYNGSTFSHEIQVNGEILSVADGTLNPYIDSNGGRNAYFSVQFYPLPEGNTQTFAVDYFDDQGVRLPEFSGTLTATFENTSLAPVSLVGSALPDGVEHTAYSHNISIGVSGGALPYTFALDGGTVLPLGLSLSPSGVVSGIPTQADSYSFDVKVTDSKMPTNQTDTATYSITIHEAGTPEPPPTGLEPAVFAQNPMRLDLNGDRTGRFVISLGSSGIRADIVSSNPTVASISANPVTESGKNSYVQGKSVGTAEISVTFYDANGEMTGITNDRFTVEVVNSSGGSDRDSSGSSKSDTSTVVQPRPVTLAETMEAYRKALPNAANGTVTVRLSGWFSEIDLSIQQALAKQAAKDGVTVKLQISQVQNFTTVARLTLNPVEATTKVQLMASTTTPDAVNRGAFFRKWFSNKLFVVATGQTGSYGQPMEVVVKTDLTGVDTAKLVLYSYDKAANTYKQIPDAGAWLDKNGYFHFTTNYAGDIIISNGELVRK